MTEINSFDIFISYSEKDKKLADAICHYLEERKIRCWIAPRDVRAGYDFASEIVKAIKDCKTLLLVLSENSNNSKHVTNEIDIAFQNSKLIVPFKIENTILNDSMTYYLNKKHWIDAFPNPSENFELLFEQLKKVMPVSSEDNNLDDEDSERSLSYKEIKAVDNLTSQPSSLNEKKIKSTKKKTIFIVAITLLLILISVFVIVDHFAWQKAKKEDTAISYGVYLGQYPIRLHIKEAQILRNEARLDLEARNRAFTENTESSYKEYLKNYPDGRYSEEILKKMNDLNISY